MRLVVLPVAELGDPSDRFRCIPFAATITGKTCVDRQQAAGATWNTTTKRTAEVVTARTLARQFARCASCPLGESVAARLATLAPT